MHVSVNVPPRDAEIIEWVRRLQRDNVKVSAAIRRILRAHIRAEEGLTVEAIADAVVLRMREEGLVFSAGPAEVSIEPQIDAILSEAAREFMERG